MSEITWEIFKVILEEDILIYTKRVNGIKSMLNIQNNTMDIWAVTLKHSYIWLSLTIKMQKITEKEDTPIKDIQENIWHQ